MSWLQKCKLGRGAGFLRGKLEIRNFSYSLIFIDIIQPWKFPQLPFYFRFNNLDLNYGLFSLFPELHDLPVGISFFHSCHKNHFYYVIFLFSYLPHQIQAFYSNNNNNKSLLSFPPSTTNFPKLTYYDILKISLSPYHLFTVRKSVSLWSPTLQALPVSKSGQILIS